MQTIGDFIDDLEARIQALQGRQDLGQELAEALSDVADSPAAVRNAMLEATVALGQLENTVKEIEENFSNENNGCSWGGNF